MQKAKTLKSQVLDKVSKLGLKSAKGNQVENFSPSMVDIGQEVKIAQTSRNRTTNRTVQDVTRDKDLNCELNEKLDENLKKVERNTEGTNHNDQIPSPEGSLAVSPDRKVGFTQ